MRWLQTEYLLKGIYLGLVLHAALQLAAIPKDQPALFQQGLLLVNACALAGLGLALVLTGLAKLREGFRVRGRLLPFLLFLLLESPTLTYIGILGGTVTGMVLLNDTLIEALSAERLESLRNLLTPIVGGGAIVGLAFGNLRQVQNRNMRLALVLLLAGVLVTAGLAWLAPEYVKLFNIKPYALDDPTKFNPTAFAVELLLGIPFFYLLTFAGHEEETEIEIGILSGVLGLGMALLFGDNKQMGSLAILLPLLLYFGYTLKVLPGLRVLKHAFRGLSYTRVGRYRKALQAFRRALALEPGNRLAREGFWEVHRQLDLDELVKDPQLLALVDLDLCLDRAGTLLIAGKPAPEQLAEAHRLLDMVLRLAPDRHPPVDYWRAVAHTHSRQLDLAAKELAGLLDPNHHGADNPQRLSVLLPAWQLSLMLHPELQRRVGVPQLAEPGRRMEAIAAVERHAVDNPDDKGFWDLKRLLYRDLTEAEYDVGAGAEGVAARHFDHSYAQQLGLALINDDVHWKRGGEYLRLAARGLPTMGPTLFTQIAQAHQRAGHQEEARHNYELAKRAGQGVGHKNLADAERVAYFATVKLLGEEAMARNDWEAAIENFRLYSESERSGIETLRTLAELYERRGDPLAAARVTDQALQYNSADKDLLARKDRYYYSILPEHLQARLEHYGHGFDVDYCLKKSKSILDRRDSDLEWMDVARHLTLLALVVRPESLAAKVMQARVNLRLGERDEAMRRMEEVRGPAKPEKFAGGAEDEEAWFVASQLLGDLYLETGEAEKAVACLNDFRRSSKSGARTWFKMAQAYEQLGDPGKAVKRYQQVTAYEHNPLAPDAEEAIARLKG